MFVILKKIINVINEQSKSYFISKLQEYDELIDEKEQQLDKIKTNISNLKKENLSTSILPNNIKNDYYYTDKIPSYQDEDIIKSYKKIEKFHLDNEKIVKDFIKNLPPKTTKEEYDLLVSIKEKLTFDLIYDLTIKNDEEQLKILNKILNKKQLKVISTYIEENEEAFDISKFQSYLEERIPKLDPTIYILVGSPNENYNSLHKNIKTKYQEDIFKGISIIYKNKIYDYTLK